jgi:glutamate/tyrosine decarboxylase-like PLP-dependent enzyme
MGLYPYSERYAVNRGMPSEGRSRDAVLAEIRQMSAEEDSRAHEGKISGSIYSGDPEHYAFLNEVFGHYSHANVLQRDMYPSATRFEGEIIAMTADMLHGGPMHGAAVADVCGVLTSGGTESLMNPLLVYREWGRERGITTPNVVMPVTAHPALDKGAHYFGIELRKAVVTDRFVADMESMRSLIDSDTVALVGSAGSYPHGAIDPIGELSDLALEHGINLHVDGCLGGFVLAWGGALGYPVPPFDFRLPGVTSISADTHKYGFALKGSSVLLYRSPELRRMQYFVVSDWPGGLYTSPGMSGSRSGGIIATAWAAMVTLGRDGYTRIAGEIFRTAAELKQIIGSHPELRVLGDPFFDVAFSHAADVAVSRGVDIFHVNDSLAANGWRLNGLQRPPAIHFCITRPNTQPGVMERFERDLAGAVEYARERAGTKPRSGATYGGGGVEAPRDAVAAGMVGWLDATQALPPSPR